MCERPTSQTGGVDHKTNVIQGPGAWAVESGEQVGLPRTMGELTKPGRMWQASE